MPLSPCLRIVIFGALHIAVSTSAEDAYYIVQGNSSNVCLDDECTTRVAIEHEVRAVRCCDDAFAGHYDSEWTYVESCGIWAISHLFPSDVSDMCYMTTWEKADWLCDTAGGRLCSKRELEDGCTAGTGCEFDEYMVWSGDSGELTLDTPPPSDTRALTYHFAVQGSVAGLCWESPCVTEEVPNVDAKGVRCCSDTEVDNWLNRCGIWAESDVPFCYLVDWDTANQICNEAGGRLCTKAEIENDCSAGTGCIFDQMMVWSGTEIIYPTWGPVDSYYVVLKNKCSNENGCYYSVSKRESMAVTCCADVETGVSVDNNWEYLTNCDLWVKFPFGRCFVADWEKASSLCDRDGGRLCTKDELENGCSPNIRDSGCSFEFDMLPVWSSTLEGNVDFGPIEDVNYYYVAKGLKQSSCWESDCNTAVVHEYDLKAVRCCSDTEKGDGWVEKCGIWAESEVSFCYVVDWATANMICSMVGARLCTVNEIENDCTSDTGCAFNSMLVWSNTSHEI